MDVETQYFASLPAVYFFYNSRQFVKKKLKKSGCWPKCDMMKFIHLLITGLMNFVIDF